MSIFRYIATAVLLVSPIIVSAYSGVTRHRDIEPPRSEMNPFNSDSLMRDSIAERSLYISAIEKWSRSDGDKGCDTLYTANFIVPFEWINREVILRINYADAPYTLEVNGTEVASVSNGGSRTEFNITRQSVEGMNSVALRLSPNSPSRAIEGWRAGGALRPEPIEGATVIAPAKMSVRDIFTRTGSSEDGVMSSEIGVVLKSYNLNERVSVWRYRLRNSDGKVVANGKDSVMLRYRGEDTLYISTILPKEDAWGSGAGERRGEMHQLTIELMHEGRVAEIHRLPLGLRNVKIDKEGRLSLNGEAMKLRAQSVTERISRGEIERLLRSGVNTLIFPAGSESYGLYEMLSVCDEVGMFAIVTAPIDSRKSGYDIMVGGNTTNDPKWLEEYIERLERGYHNARRHPSVIGYNMATKSLNGYNLYEGYVNLKGIDRVMPILNLDGGGEWNGDAIEFELIKKF